MWCGKGAGEGGNVCITLSLSPQALNDSADELNNKRFDELAILFALDLLVS